MKQSSYLFVLVAVLFSTSVVVALQASEANWTGWRGADRNGKSPDAGLNHDWEAAPPELVYMAEGLGNGYASVAVSGGRIYTTGNFSDGQAVVALSVADGKQLWKTPVTEEAPRHGYAGSRSTPAVDGDRLYIVSSAGAIVCLDAASGEIKWSKDFKSEWNGRMMSGWGFSESPLVDGDLVLCTPGGSTAMIVALNKMTGAEVWRSEVPDLGGRGRRAAGYSSIVISHGAGVKQYVQLVGQGVIGVRASDGKFLWGYSDVANGTANIPTPIVEGDFVFASTGYGAGAALLKLRAEGDRVEAEEVYFLDRRELQNHHGGMVLVDGHIYCGHGHNSGFPVCIEMETGQAVWGRDQRGPGRGSAAVTYADGHMVFRYQSGEVALIEATTGGYQLKGVLTPEFQQGNSWAHPVVIGGKLYLREQDKLMCYDLRAK